MTVRGAVIQPWVLANQGMRYAKPPDAKIKTTKPTEPSNTSQMVQKQSHL